MLGAVRQAAKLSQAFDAVSICAATWMPPNDPSQAAPMCQERSKKPLEFRGEDINRNKAECLGSDYSPPNDWQVIRWPRNE